VGGLFASPTELGCPMVLVATLSPSTGLSSQANSAGVSESAPALQFLEGPARAGTARLVSNKSKIYLGRLLRRQVECQSGRTSKRDKLENRMGLIMRELEPRFETPRGDTYSSDDGREVLRTRRRLHAKKLQRLGLQGAGDAVSVATGISRYTRSIQTS